MGKVDDMRRQREDRLAQIERAAKSRDGAPAEAAPAPPIAPAPARAKRVGAKEETGKCSACGKARELRNGLISSHQKGLGKWCPGSNKAPA